MKKQCSARAVEAAVLMSKKAIERYDALPSNGLFDCMPIESPVAFVVPAAIPFAAVYVKITWSLNTDSPMATCIPVVDPNAW